MIKSIFTSAVILIISMFSTNSYGKEPSSFPAVIDKVSPSVVQIVVSIKRPDYSRSELLIGRRYIPFERRLYSIGILLDKYVTKYLHKCCPKYFKTYVTTKRSKITYASGTGFIVNKKGYIMTCAHVVSDSFSIDVTLTDGSIYKAKIIGLDIQSDLALISIKTKKKLSVATLGDSGKLKVGDQVIAIGYPFGLDKAATQGIISAVEQTAEVGGYERDGMIQTDTAINHGNSGGPLYNMKGEVIGITESLYSPTEGFCGIGYAVNSNLAKSILFHLKTYGHVKRGYFGGMIKDTKKGVIVDMLYLGAPADRAGIKEGDIVIELNGIKIKNAKQLKFMVDYQLADREVKIVVSRHGRIKASKIFIEEY